MRSKPVGECLASRDDDDAALVPHRLRRHPRHVDAAHKEAAARGVRRGAPHQHPRHLDGMLELQATFDGLQGKKDEKTW